MAWELQQPPTTNHPKLASQLASPASCHLHHGQSRCERFAAFCTGRALGLTSREESLLRYRNDSLLRRSLPKSRSISIKNLIRPTATEAPSDSPRGAAIRAGFNLGCTTTSALDPAPPGADLAGHESPSGPPCPVLSGRHSCSRCAARPRRNSLQKAGASMQLQPRGEPTFA